MATEVPFILSPLVPGLNSIDRGLGRLMRSVAIDNTTGQWWRISGTDRRIPPYTVSLVIRLPAGTQVAQVVADTPPSFTSSPRVGETAVFIYSDDEKREEPGVKVSPTPLPTPTLASTPTNGAGTIAVAATAQTIFAANTGRTYLTIQNRSTSVLAVEIDGTVAVQGTSLALNPAVAGEGGGSITFEGSFVPDTLISIIGPVGGEQFVAYEAG